jgi:predicted ATPase
MLCAQCGFANQPQAKFCGECGAVLPPQAGVSSGPPLALRPHAPLSYTPTYLAEKIFASKTALEGERKQVTVHIRVGLNVGRQAELEALCQALERTDTGHGQVVAVIGEVGVGKSRLLYEFTRSHHTHGWLLLEGSAVSYGKAMPYLPVRELLKAYFQIEERDDAQQIREKVTDKLLTLDPALESTLPAFLTLLDVPLDDPSWQALDPPQRRQRTLDAMKRLLLRESQAQPLLLVFENLHCLDAETQTLLDSLIVGLPTARVLLLVNYRPEYRHGWESQTSSTQLRLDALPPESADELPQALLGNDAGLALLKRLLIERTEGNPLFLEDSVRALVETGVLIGERRAYRLARLLVSLQVQATVQVVLAEVEGR